MSTIENNPLISKFFKNFQKIIEKDFDIKKEFDEKIETIKKSYKEIYDLKVKDTPMTQQEYEDLMRSVEETEKEYKEIKEDIGKDEQLIVIKKIINETREYLDNLLDAIEKSIKNKSFSSLKEYYNTSVF